MKFKLNTLLAAVVLSATAMSANARIESSNGSSEFVFSAWDNVTGVGYTYDLNWDKFLNDFVGPDQFTTAAGNAALLAGANVAESLIGADGIIFDDVLTGLPFTGQSLTDAQWSLGAYDSLGRTRALLTQGDDGLPFASNNTQVRFPANALSAYFPASNGFITVEADDTFALTVQADGPGYAGITGSNFNGNTVDHTNVFGGTSSLWFLAQTTQVPSQAAAFNQQIFAFDGREVFAKTYLQEGQWRLQIAVAPIPEPETYAMLLAGLGLVGAIARRRNKSA